MVEVRGQLNWWNLNLFSSTCENSSCCHDYGTGQRKQSLLPVWFLSLNQTGSCWRAASCQCDDELQCAAACWNDWCWATGKWSTLQLFCLGPNKETSTHWTYLHRRAVYVKVEASAGRCVHTVSTSGSRLGRLGHEDAAAAPVYSSWQEWIIYPPPSWLWKVPMEVRWWSTEHTLSDASPRSILWCIKLNGFSY